MNARRRRFKHGDDPLEAWPSPSGLFDVAAIESQRTLQCLKMASGSPGQSITEAARIRPFWRSPMLTVGRCMLGAS